MARKSILPTDTHRDARDGIMISKSKFQTPPDWNSSADRRIKFPNCYTGDSWN